MPTTTTAFSRCSIRSRPRPCRQRMSPGRSAPSCGSKERPGDHGAGHRHRRRGAPRAHQRDRSSLRLSASWPPERPTPISVTTIGRHSRPGSSTSRDATEIRRRFLIAFERAEVIEAEAERRRLLTFVIVGGGATGVEMAGAIAEVARRTLQHDFRRIDPRNSRIVLIEAGPRLLPTFPEALSDYATRSLQKMGVEVELSRMVTGCDAQGVSLDNGPHRGGDGDLGGRRRRLAGGDVDRRRA